MQKQLSTTNNNQPNTLNSHFISQVLLKRFSTNNLIRVTNIKRLTSAYLGPRQIGYIELPFKHFSKLERKWQNTEKRVNEAFKALDSGNLLKSPKDIDTVKKLMGIHYLRSKPFYILLAKNEAQHFEEFLSEAVKNHPDKKDEILATIPELRQDWVNSLPKNTVDLVKSVSQKVENYINRYELEIGIASKEVNFLLSDNPAINASNDGKMGILSGLTIDQSDSFIMPLGPTYVAALITKNPKKTYRLLSNKEVRNLNAKTIQQSIEEYYSAF